jgi:hypothetical protein
MKNKQKLINEIIKKKLNLIEDKYHTSDHAFIELLTEYKEELGMFLIGLDNIETFDNKTDCAGYSYFLDDQLEFLELYRQFIIPKSINRESIQLKDFYKKVNEIATQHIKIINAIVNQIPNED